MNNLINKIDNDKIIYIENIGNFNTNQLTANKQLCIIKTNFKDLPQIKSFAKAYQNLDIWLTSENITRKNIFSANNCGIKNVLPYPIQLEVLLEYFKAKPKKDKPEPVFNEDFLKNKRILILDDNILNIELLEETLKPLNLEVHSFLKPQDAIESTRHIKYDLLLLDIMIPEISGFDTAEIIQASTPNQNTPIIFISALSDAENKIRGYNLGSIAYIEKPFNISVVQSQIYNILKSKSLQDALEDTKETFLAMVTHDLKTPINAEICALELLLKNKSADSFEHEIICDMLSASKYMKNLVENLLLKYKSENNEIVLQREHYQIENIIRKCIEEIHYLTQDKEQKISFKNKTKDNTALVDYIEIKRTINNLLTNANQYSVPKSTISIELKEDAHNFIVEIINKSDKERSKNLKEDIFEKFVQCNKSSKTINTGLGLYICKKIVQLHGGEIHYEPLSANRNKFWFSLPKPLTAQK
ncbi:MAG: hybrid sensor histidine kinase/response regulator [Fusobacterium sp.]|nr:hybrid sensor histidine kinase/response regulator [Fusobacterium sp.]